MSTHSKILWRPRQFVEHPTPLYAETLTLLRRLQQAEGLDVVGQCLADATAEAALADFVRSRQVRQQRGGHVCVRRLLGQRCTGLCPNIPGGDHLTEWCRDGETVAIVSQPYGLSTWRLEQTMVFAAEYGLDAAIDTYPSWHFPGSVLTVVFTRKGFCLGAV